MKFRTLMPHQLDALRWALPRKNIALFLEMRLGKTLITIRWVKQTHSKPRVLIIAPSPALPEWEDELRKERIPSSDIIYLVGTPEKRLQPLVDFDKTWYLITFDTLRNSPVALTSLWTHIVVDESTRIRNPKAKITRTLTKGHILNCTEARKAILSGLPNPESDLDYFCQLNFLEPKFLGYDNYWKFRQGLFRKYGYDWYVKSHAKKKILEGISKVAFVLSRKDAGIGSKKIYETRYIQATPEQKKLFGLIKKEFTYYEGKDYSPEKSTKWVLIRLQWLSRVAGGFDPEGNVIRSGKLKELLNLVQGELCREKVVVWFRYSQEIHSTVHHMRKAGLQVESYTGKNNLSEKKGILKRFRGKDTRILCVQGKCARYALDLSVSSTSIYYSNWYDGEIRAQSEDRIIHPQKKEPVLYIDLITEKSIDETVIRLLRKKKFRSHLFIEALKREVLQWT